MCRRQHRTSRPLCGGVHCELFRSVQLALPPHVNPIANRVPAVLEICLMFYYGAGKKSSCNEAQTQMPPSMPAVCCQFCNGWFALRFSTTNAARSTHYFFLLFFPSDCIPLDDALIFSAILPRDSVLVRVLEHSETSSDPFCRLQSTLTSQKKYHRDRSKQRMRPGEWNIAYFEHSWKRCPLTRGVTIKNNAKDCHFYLTCRVPIPSKLIYCVCSTSPNKASVNSAL